MLKTRYPIATALHLGTNTTDLTPTQAATRRLRLEPGSCSPGDLVVVARCSRFVKGHRCAGRAVSHVYKCLPDPRKDGRRAETAGRCLSRQCLSGRLGPSAGQALLWIPTTHWHPHFTEEEIKGRDVRTRPGHTALKRWSKSHTRVSAFERPSTSKVSPAPSPAGRWSRGLEAQISVLNTRDTFREPCCVLQKTEEGPWGGWGRLQATGRACCPPAPLGVGGQGAREGSVSGTSRSSGTWAPGAGAVAHSIIRSRLSREEGDRATLQPGQAPRHNGPRPLVLHWAGRWSLQAKGSVQGGHHQATSPCFSRMRSGMAESFLKRLVPAPTPSSLPSLAPWSRRFLASMWGATPGQCFKIHPQQLWSTVHSIQGTKRLPRPRGQALPSVLGPSADLGSPSLSPLTDGETEATEVNHWPEPEFENWPGAHDSCGFRRVTGSGDRSWQQERGPGPMCLAAACLLSWPWALCEPRFSPPRHHRQLPAHATKISQRPPRWPCLRGTAVALKKTGCGPSGSAFPEATGHAQAQRSQAEPWGGKKNLFCRQTRPPARDPVGPLSGVARGPEV